MSRSHECERCTQECVRHVLASVAVQSKHMHIRVNSRQGGERCGPGGLLSAMIQDIRFAMAAAASREGLRSRRHTHPGSRHWSHHRQDPVTLACVSMALLAAGAVAMALPARRAARTGPMAALGQE